jgi:lantibiotic biosynthesis protein
VENEAPLFLPASFFMVRTPLLPFDNFLALMQRSDINDCLIALFDKDAQMREALAIASPSLYTALKSRKDTKQARLSLLKYFSRMTTRSTPFGIFSFVALGTFSEVTSVTFDLSKVYKRARPDMEWLMAMIDQICADPRYFSILPLYRNPLVFESGGRAFLNYLRKENAEDEFKTVSIRLSYLTQAIFQLTKKSISINDLQDKIMQRFPALEREKVLGVIQQLLKQQFLSFSLLPSLLTECPFKDMLSSLPASAASLSNIVSKIENYHRTQVGQGEQQLLELQESLKNVAETKNCIQVDSAYAATDLTLSKEIGNELAEAAEVLWKLSSAQSLPSLLEPYHKKFLEKYGVHRTVPLLELLDGNGGLGAPEVYTKKTFEAHPKSHQNNLWSKWLKQQWMQCIRDKGKEIVIGEEDIEKMLEKKDKTKAVLSFDLFCEVIANSSRQVDEKDYLLVISAYASQGGAAFGRFVDLLGSSAKDKLAAFHLEEEALEANNVFAQSSYLSFLPRHANVSIHPSMRRHTINLASPDGIPLDEIFIGATSDRLYLTLKDHCQELIVTAGNMLSSLTAPVPLRFIRDVSMARQQMFYLFPWNDLQEHSYLPRVRFKNVIFSPARWKVDLFYLGITAKESLETVEKKFHAWRHDWDLPRYVFTGETDQRFLIDLDHFDARHEVIRQIRNGQEVTFVEKIGQSEGHWIKSERGSHLSEFVIPFLKNPTYSTAKPQHYFPKREAVSIHSRMKLPCSEWLFAKCYLDLNQDTRFLLDHCVRFADSLLQQKVITDWFFVRYGDPKYHLRLRFKGNREQIIAQAMPALHQWAHQLIEQRFIYEMVLAPYEREIERYGGEALIESAEALFHADSISVVDLLNAMRSMQITLAEEVAAALSLVDMLKGLNLDSKQQLAFFSSHEMAKNELSGFRNCKTALVSFGRAILGNTLESHSKEGLILSRVFQKRKKALQEFARKMQEAEEKKELITSSQMIQSSLLHMHCNRLLGTDSKKEIKAKLFAYQTLKTIDLSSASQVND